MLISHNVSFDDGSVFSIRARRLQIDSICSVYTIIQQPPLGYCDMCGTKGRVEEKNKESSAGIHQTNSFKVLCFQSGILFLEYHERKKHFYTFRHLIHECKVHLDGSNLFEKVDTLKWIKFF